MDDQELADSTSLEPDPLPGVLEDIRTNVGDAVHLNEWVLDHKDVKLLAEALQGNRAVRSLHLRAALYGRDVGAMLKTLAPAVQTSRITDLDLGYNGIDKAEITSFFVSLKGAAVQRLKFEANWLEDGGAAVLADALKDVHVTDLELLGNGIQNDGAKALAAALAASSVRALNLGRNRIGQEGAEALAKGLQASSVTALFLSDNMVGDEGAKALAIALKTSSLQILLLEYNCISDEGVKALASGIPGSSIKELNLSYNPIGNDGAKALATVLKDSNIEALDLANCYIDEEGWKALLEEVRDTAVTSFVGPFWGARIEGETSKQLQAALEANMARTFVLQMQVDGDETEWTSTFRTMAGTVAAVLNWSFDRSAKDLPEAVFEGMRASGFQLPSRHLRAHNLRILRPDGQVLDVREDAAPLVSQLGDLKRRRLH